MDEPTIAQMTDALRVLLPVSAVIVAGLWWWGLSLRNAPDRDVRLHLPELLIGFMLIVGGTWIGGLTINAMGIFDRELNEWDYARLMLIIQIAMTVPLALFLLLMWWGPRRDHWLRLGMLPRRPRWELKIAVIGVPVLCVLAMTVAMTTNLIGKLLDHDVPTLGHDMLRIMVESQNPFALIVLVLSAVVIAPLVEEFIYRGFLQTSLMNMMGRGTGARWLAIIVVSLLFMAAHYGIVDWQGLPGLFVVGLVVGWLYERTGSLLAPILVHAGFNAVNVALAMWVSGVEV